MIEQVVLFLIGLLVLVKGADFLVEGSISLARLFKVSDLVIGLTIVSLGTSLPELFVSILASLDGNTDILIGNILGSNIANILLIGGAAAIFARIKILDSTVWKELPLSLLAAVVVAILANELLIDGIAPPQLTRSDGLILLSFFAIFLYYVYGMKQKSEDPKHIIKPKHNLFVSVGYVLAGIIGLYLGGEFVVNGAIFIAQYLGVPQALIGLTIVAVGTSLPELVTSIVAATKNNADLAVGNIVGSNIFNLFLVLGIASLINPIYFAPERNFDVIMVVIASVALFLAAFLGKEKKTLTHREGIIFLLLYLAYLAFLIYPELSPQ